MPSHDSLTRQVFPLAASAYPLRQKEGLVAQVVKPKFRISYGFSLARLLSVFDDNFLSNKSEDHPGKQAKKSPFFRKKNSQDFTSSFSIESSRIFHPKLAVGFHRKCMGKSWVHLRETLSMREGMQDFGLIERLKYAEQK